MHKTDTVVMDQAKAELEKMKLERLGRRVLEGRIYSRRQAAFNRQIVQIVHAHIHASASELQERLNELFETRNASFGPDAEEMQAEIEKIRL